MNGAHDMGGAHGFGPVVAEVDEPTFHAEWERRVFALTIAMGASGAWNIDMSRFAREDRPPDEYLGMSYYEMWLAGLERLLAEREPKRVLAAEDVAATLARGGPADRPATRAAKFAPSATACGRGTSPALAHAAAPLRPWQGRDGRARARLPRLPRQQLAAARRGPAMALRRAFARASCGADGDPRPRCASTPSSPTSSVPEFAEPWEAQVFALAVSLSERGCSAGANGRRRWPPRTSPRALLETLERLVVERGLTDGDELARYRHAWAHAASARRTAPRSS